MTTAIAPITIFLCGLSESMRPSAASPNHFNLWGGQALLLQSKQSHTPILLSVQQFYARVSAEIFEVPATVNKRT